MRLPEGGDRMMTNHRLGLGCLFVCLSFFDIFFFFRFGVLNGDFEKGDVAFKLSL